MTPVDKMMLDMVSALADVARAKGIKSLTADGITLEMGPLDAPLRPDSAAPKDPDMCHCGCPLAGHNGGLCAVRGCSPDKCIEPESRTS